MKKQFWLENLFHFLPFWIFGLAVFTAIIFYSIEFCLSFAENKKLLYDFQDSWMGNNRFYGGMVLMSFILSWGWAVLIFFLRRKRDLSDRCCCALGFFLFPIITAAAVINFLPHKPSRYRAERHHRVHCRSNMKQLGIALVMYAQDNNGFYPDKLEMISSYCGDDQESFQCPAAKNKEGFSDYIYFGKDKKVADPVFVLLEDKTENHRGNFKNQLMSNGEMLSAKKIE